MNIHNGLFFTILPNVPASSLNVPRTAKPSWSRVAR